MRLSQRVSEVLGGPELLGSSPGGVFSEIVELLDSPDFCLTFDFALLGFPLLGFPLLGILR